MSVAVLGAGAFGTSLAMALSRDGAPVTLWARDREIARTMQKTRETGTRLPGFSLPPTLTVSDDLTALEASTVLLALPMQSLAGFLADTPSLAHCQLIACCKGIDRATGLGPVATIQAAHPEATAALLTGPSFAADIARGLPTALVIATRRDSNAQRLQKELSRPALRLYRSTDVTGAELGGALKNVVALAAGIAIGAGLGDSARASVIARGFAEIGRFAAAKGAETETLQGLSGLGDLVLTCTSEKSRNFVAGLTLGRGDVPDPTKTVEGIATASAIAALSDDLGIDMPLSRAVASVAEGRLDIKAAINALLARPVGTE